MANLVASILAYIFRSTLSNEMGLKFYGESDFLPGFCKVMIEADNISGGKEALETEVL